MQSHHNDAISHLDKALRDSYYILLEIYYYTSVFNAAKEACLQLNSVLEVEHISH